MTKYKYDDCTRPLFSAICVFITSYVSLYWVNDTTEIKPLLHLMLYSQIIRDRMVNFCGHIEVANVTAVLICGLLYQKQLSRARVCNYIPQILWNVITCPCPWYLFWRTCGLVCQKQVSWTGTSDYIPQILLVPFCLSSFRFYAIFNLASLVLWNP